MHVTERDRIILSLLKERGFVTQHEMQEHLQSSPATLRRDLERLQAAGKLSRVHGGAQGIEISSDDIAHLQGSPFHENINRNRAAKEAIGRTAAGLCRPGEAVIIDGGSTTLQMCPHLEPLGLQVFTNSLHIVSALLPQPNTGISIPGGAVFREQNIVLDLFDEDARRTFHAAKMFLSCAAVSSFGLMQSDIMLVQAERKLLGLADKIVVLADSSKFSASAGHILCELNRVHTLITDDAIDPNAVALVNERGIELIRAKVE